MSEKYVVRLKNAAIYHADNPFGSTSAEKLMRRGEMVLSDVNLCVAPGEFVYLIGRVGSGKSTLLKTLYAEVQLLTGEGRVAGYDLRRLRRRDIPHLRRRIGIVFQDYQLLTDRNVFMNLYYVMKATGWKREDEIRERIDQVLKLVDLGAKSYKMPFELSGGEQQRLVIARAILNNPQVLLADEPTGNLDPVTAEGIMQLFQEIAGRGCAVVMSTHNTALIENYPARASSLRRAISARSTSRRNSGSRPRIPHAPAPSGGCCGTSCPMRAQRPPKRPANAKNRLAEAMRLLFIRDIFRIFVRYFKDDR